MDSNKEDLLFFHYNEHIRNKDQTILRHYYVRPDSTVATIDEVMLEKGEFKQSKADFLEVDETGMVIRDGDRMTLSFRKADKNKERELDYPADLLVGPLFNIHIKKNWDKLIEGEKIYFKLPAPDIQQVATFTFQEVKNSEYNKEGHIVFELDAASFFLQLLVKPSFFVYQISSQKLMEIHGTTILRTKQNGKWQNTTDVNMYYEYWDDK
ncbi:MAG: hypothetical protein K9N39_07930 [Candidatus Cloacimonetes bacterium]|nr:hypothetical protein [Candidatus Cloacimonadota bacterium]